MADNEILEAIIYQQDNEPNEVVYELNLDQCHFEQITESIKQKLEQYENLVVLTLNECNLRQLQNLPNLSNLLRMELIDNPLEAGELKNLQKYKNLQSLSLGKIQTFTFDDLKDLQDNKNLIQLDLTETNFFYMENYRKLIFELLPQLQILDNLNRNDEQYQYDQGNLYEQNLGYSQQQYQELINFQQGIYRIQDQQIQQAKKADQFQQIIQNETQQFDPSIYQDQFQQQFQPENPEPAENQENQENQEKQENPYFEMAEVNQEKEENQENLEVNKKVKL